MRRDLHYCTVLTKSGQSLWSVLLTGGNNTFDVTVKEEEEEDEVELIGG